MVEKVREKKKFFLIRSEYEKLDVDLRNVLDAFIEDDKEEYIQEFEWKIVGADFKEFMALDVQSSQDNYTNYKGPSYEVKCVEHGTGNEQNILIRPSIIRSHPSLPQYCSIGINIESIPSETSVDFWWSVSVKEVSYSPGREISALGVREGGFEGMRAFKNKKLKKVKSLTLKLYIRPHEYEEDDDKQ